MPGPLGWSQELPKHTKAPTAGGNSVQTPQSKNLVVQVHCGLSGTCSLLVAVRSVVKLMLRREHCNLSPRLWHSACMFVLSRLQNSVIDAEAQYGHAEASLKEHIATGSMSIADVPATQLVLSKLLLHEVREAAQLGLEQVYAQAFCILSCNKQFETAVLLCHSSDCGVFVCNA